MARIGGKGMTEEIIKEEFDKAFKKNFPEAVIIDGVNVAKCEFFDNYECNIYVNEYWEPQDNTKDMCKWHENCYYKQLKRLEQENKELKEKYSHVLELAKTNADSNEYCLQELEKKYEELKEELKSYKHPDVVTLLTNWRTGELDRIHNKIANERDTYRSALEEIQQIAIDSYSTGTHTSCENGLKEIENKINEVLNESN